ncbi:MAG: ATPase, T2SS/T4P/T4SS family [Verrucomicrobiia bacterium]
MNENSRFRCNLLKQVNGYGAVFRLIPTQIASLEELGMPPVIKNFAHLRGGLVLVTGPTGSGKSTTLAALIDYINTSLSRHIVTIEEPIEFVHGNKKASSLNAKFPMTHQSLLEVSESRLARRLRYRARRRNARFGDHIFSAYRC